MTEYETFMVYELDNSGERIKLEFPEEQIQEKLHPEQVLVIVREDLRRIFIWKGPKSPVRKRFISSRVASALQEELMKDQRYHRCKIVSVDAGDEPSEFLNAFKLESMVVSERLADMRYVRNIERERMGEVVITDVAPKTTKPKVKGVYFSPALQDTSSDVVISSFSSSKPKQSISYPRSAPAKQTRTSGGVRISEEETQKIKDKILKTEVSEGLKRSNLVLGHTLYAAVSKVANVFGKEVEQTSWEAVKKVPNEMIQLNNHILRVYFNEKNGIVEAIEVLEKKGEFSSASKKQSVSGLSPMPSKPASMKKTSTDSISQKKVDFNSMTVKNLKTYADEIKIDLPANARKAEIIDILEKSEKKKPNSRRELPKIPSSDD